MRGGNGSLIVENREEVMTILKQVAKKAASVFIWAFMWDYHQATKAARAGLPPDPNAVHKAQWRNCWP